MDFHETWIEDAIRPRTDPIHFLVRIQIKGRRTPLSAALVVDALKCKQQIQEKQLAKMYHTEIGM